LLLWKSAVEFPEILKVTFGLELDGSDALGTSDISKFYQLGYILSVIVQFPYLTPYRYHLQTKPTVPELGY